MTTLRLMPDLEESLRTLPDVEAVSVVTDGTGRPLEVHVLARPGKAPKQLVRDVQSLAMAVHDLDLDHRIVSVVQVGDPAAEDSPAGVGAGAAAAQRPAVRAVGVLTEGTQATATVVLAHDGGVVEGRAVGGVGASQRARLVARATLDAVEHLLGLTAEVESVQVVSADGRRVALCVLALTTSSTEELALSGAAVVRTDEHDAVTRCVLAALNRRLTG